MQIVQWLFKLANDQCREAGSISHDSALTNRRTYPKDTIPSRTSRGSKRGQQSNNKRFRHLKLLCRRDVAKDIFCSTLSLTRVSSFNSTRTRRRIKGWEFMMMNMKQEEVSRRFRPDSNTIKVLPVTEASVWGLATDHQGDAKEKAKKKKKEQNKTKAAISRMKELIRWTAATKSDEAGKLMSPHEVLYYESRETSEKKQLKDNHELNGDSSKINLGQDIGSCSSLGTCTEHSISLNSMPYHCGTRQGNWITTDSEFVVLEL